MPLSWSNLAPAPASPPAPLAERLVYAGADLDAALAVSGRVFCPHTVRRLDRSRPVDIRQYAATVGELTISQVSYGTAVEIVAGEHPDRFFCVQICNGGRAEVASGAERVVSSFRLASVPSPSEVLRMRWEARTSQTVIKIPAPTVRSYLTRLLGHPPRDTVRPILALDLRSYDGARWLAIYQLLLAELANRDRDRAAPTASEAAVQDLVLSSLLLSHPNNYSEELTRPWRGETRPYVHRAIEFANENLDAPLTVAILAEVAGVGVRALQAGFREAVGCSPTAWIRTRRLEAAHAELLAAEPGDGTTVTDVALRWGFSHFGRFSVSYRQQFGVSPSRTLRG